MQAKLRVYMCSSTRMTTSSATFSRYACHNRYHHEYMQDVLQELGVPASINERIYAVRFAEHMHAIIDTLTVACSTPHKICMPESTRERMYAVRFAPNMLARIHIIKNTRVAKCFDLSSPKYPTLARTKIHSKRALFIIKVI